MTYDALLRQMWSRKEKADENRVRAWVKTLRRRLGDDATRPTYIVNERAVGYRMPGPHDI